ncbi:MAG: malate dehydrogenase [Candidatus Omnitrophica bacterium]|nr:malate dehydrogenase [Candidatus Omnitrophota bacterium]
MIKKVTIIGSGGVGSGVAFHLLSLLPLKEIVLLDLSGDLAKGVALDLEDTRGFLNFSTKITGSKDLSQLKDSDIVVITAGVARKDGMTRLDLLKINSKIAIDLSRQIKRFAPFSVVITVTNPLDMITYFVSKETGFSRGRVLGMGSSLDTSRLMNIISKRLKISTSSLEGFVFGAHSKDMIVSSQRLKVNGQPLDNFEKKEVIEKIIESVQMRGAEIVKYLKTRSATFAPSLSCAHLIKAIALDSNEIIPVSALLDGEYGLKDVCVGVPCLINRKGIEKIIEIDLTDDEKEAILKVKQSFKECMI